MGKCCKCMSPATVCIKRFGSTKSARHLVFLEQETLKVRQEMVCKVLVVPLLRHAGLI